MMRARYGNRLKKTLLIAAVATLGVSLTHLTFAASGSLTFNPSSDSATVGNNLVITMHENSGSDAAIGVDAYVNYSPTLLQFVSATTSTAFSVAPPDNANNGTVEIVRGAYSGVTGDQIVSVLTFKVLAAGTASVSFDAGKSSISPAVGSGNLLTTSPGGSYSLSAVPTPPDPNPNPNPNPNPTPSTPTASSKGKSVNVSGVTVPDKGSVAISTPAIIEPSTIQTDGVKKVEYYLNNKLVDTETTPPFKYNIDTNKYNNGSYDLVSKTYYTNGSVKLSTQHLIVKNVSAKKSAVNTIGYTLLLLLIIVCVVAALLRKHGGSLRGRFAMASSDSVVTSDNPKPAEVTPNKAVQAANQDSSTVVTPAVMPVAPPANSSPIPPVATTAPQPGTTIQVTEPPDEKL